MQVRILPAPHQYLEEGKSVINEIQGHAKELGIDLSAWTEPKKRVKDRTLGATSRRKKTKAQRQARKIQRRKS
ncbi:MAG: hypothetical protein CVV44_04130 [Spirochaetae bacterium HGW-Spirochaetae-1]|nr:MAG: hypothetical protein CVV44_04130 [Spirochaetae bacterium HGW-Spirochaetae-1]